MFCSFAVLNQSQSCAYDAAANSTLSCQEVLIGNIADYCLLVFI
jgi:hypothetical protein